MQILELYAGIGGIATAIRGLDFSIACAVDIDSAALHFYSANHPHRTLIAAIRSGSYVRLSGGGYRYFHPREIASLLGFPLDYVLPPEHRSAYRFLGNSLSIDVVRALYFQSP